MTGGVHFEALATSAPGKLMLSGEYVVLDGVRALVAAVDVRARAYWVDALAEGRKTAPKEVRSTSNVCRWRGFHPAAIDGMPLEISVMTNDFYVDGQKLGLGSSAASAAATAAAHVLERFPLLGSALDDTFRAAFDGHRSSVGAHGSGADVAASVYGGFLEIEKHGEYPECRAVAFPRGLFTSVVWSKESSRTSDAVASARRVAKNDVARYEDAAGPLKEAANAFADAFAANDAAGAIRACASHHDAMRTFGEKLGIPVVTGALEEIARLALSAGGAAKPSGAGGGDCAIAFFDDAAKKRAFDDACLAQNLALARITLGAPGVRDERILGSR